MATRLRDENAIHGPQGMEEDVKMAVAVDVGGKRRRALGDIGVNGANLPGRGRDKVAVKQQQAPVAAGVRVTRSQTRGGGAEHAGAAAPSGGPPQQARGDVAAAAVAAAARRAAPRRPPLPDIDAPDRGNPLTANEYVEDVYAFYRRVEPQFRPPRDYMGGQADINEKMRAILVDWLVEVHLKFKLMPETLFLAVALIDRYLAVAQVARKNLQLVGVTAMLIAAKYEEIWAPEVRDFVYISDKAYDKPQILAMERDMLRALGYKLTQPTSYQYLARLLKAANVHYEKPLALFVAYCAELCLVDYGCLAHSATDVAAAIMYVALRAFGKADAYPPALAAHARRARGEVLHVAQDVVNVLLRAPSGGLQAVVKKYATQKFCEASAVPPPLEILEERRRGGGGGGGGMA